MRIDVLEPLGSQYRVLHHFSRKLFEAFQRKGIDSRYVNSEHGIHLNWKDLPNLTIGFNGVPQSGQNHDMLCDQIAIPHLAILVDPPTWHYSLIQSPFMILTCDDRSGNRFLDSIPFDRHFFLPHAVEKDIAYNPHEEKVFDVTLLATCINHEERRMRWQQLFPAPVCKAMDAAIEVVFAQPEKGFLEAFAEALLLYVPTSKDFIFAKDPDFLQLAREIELYIKGKERVDLIHSIRDVDLHIFGASIGEKDWKKELKDHSNIHFHPPVDFEDACTIMRRSKILLNSSIKNKEGAHERIFMGMGSGAAVVTNDCPFMREEFVEGQEIVLYSPGEPDALNETLSLLLSDANKLQGITQSGRRAVLNKQTWDHRVETIMNQLPQILDRMPITR